MLMEKFEMKETTKFQICGAIYLWE